MSEKIMIVGESNPWGSGPGYELYPYPDGCAGHRLCVKIFGMSRKAYLDTFDRCNLCVGKWSIKEARIAAANLAGRRLILCGSKVCSAAGLPFEPFQIVQGGNVLLLPHPSGLCRLWGIAGAIQTAREKLREFAPELAEIIGK